jgi:predicted MFS family arabinose efflux permease
MPSGALTHIQSGPLVPFQPVPAENEPQRGKGFLINRNFALLAIGQAISNIGDFMYTTTLLVWVFSLTHSAAAISGVLIAEYTPVFLLGPVAGVFVDRWNRRTTMIVSDVLRAAVIILPFLVPAALRLPAIYTSVFLLATFSRFFMPARSGLLQVIVPAEQQPQAASITQATFALSFIIGPAIASPLYFLVGPLVATIVNTVSFLLSALCLRFIRASKEALHPYSVAKGDNVGGVGPVIRELLAGFRFVATTRVLLMVTFLALIAMLGAGALNALDIIFVTRNLHASASLYGPLIAVGGLGTLIGAICAGLVSRKMAPKYILSGSVLILGVGIVIYSFQTWIIMAMIINFLICIPQGGIDVGFGPLLLNATPQSMMGRVQSVIETAMFGVSLISVGLAGYFGQFVPVNIIFAIGGALIAISGIFGWFALPNPEKTSQIQAQE